MSETRDRLAIIGWPVGHSRSPLIHNHWLAAAGRAPNYVAHPIDPNDDFRAALEGMAAEGFIGANVTIPHKEAAFAAMDEVSVAAQSLGAVNTISFKQGRFMGANTDGDGFLLGLETAMDQAVSAAGWRDRPALVLGAGGAARAIIAALGRAGIGDIRLTNRTREKAEALTALADNVSVGDWGARQQLAEGCGLLVNTTSLGMTGQPPLDGVSAMLASLGDGALVADIVYAPLETDLLRAARAAGRHAVDGLGMLLNQAALSFEIWFGARPEIDATLRAALIADIEKG